MAATANANHMSYMDVFRRELSTLNPANQSEKRAAMRAGLALTFAEFDRLTRGNLIEAAQGKETHAGAEAVRFFASNLPGANLWYLKGAINHLFLHNIQEMLSPGYLSSMRSRAQREFGQSYYWEPGEASPDRLPNLSAAGGR